MKRIIENLRQRPDHHRRGVAAGISLVITIGIFALWVTFFRLADDESTVVAKEKENQAAVGELTGTIKLIKSQSMKLFEIIKTGIPEGHEIKVENE